ncbi:MAG TPA: ATP-binding protein, partial [Cytophagaceae bacterium]
VEYSYTVLNELEQIDLRMVEAEANVQNYTISGDKRFIVKYDRSVEKLWLSVASIKKLTSENHVQVHNSSKLKLLLDEKLSMCRFSLEHTTHKEYFKNKDWIRRVIDLNEKIDALKFKMQLEEKRLLTQRKVNAYANLSKTEQLIIIAGFVAILIAFAVVFIISKDISKKERIEYELRVLNANKDKFFSIISHDLRGPIKAIRALSDLLVNTKDVEMQQEIASHLNSSAVKATDLLENLLTWARSQMDKIDFNPTIFSIKEIVDENIASLLSSASQKEITLVNEVPKNFMVRADRNMVDVVIRNLMSNSIKFSNANGIVSINLRPKGRDKVEVIVKDTGVGIPAKELTRIFNLDNNYSTKGTANEEGTGLGLRLVKEFIEKNGGRIQVQSNPGKGSTFTFSLKKARLG